MAVLGFPEQPEDWEWKHYLRLVIIICSYVVIRPMIQGVMNHFHEKKRLEEKRVYDEEQARMHKQRRIREKLGVSVEDATASDTESTSKPEESAGGDMEHTSARKSVTSILRKRKQAPQSSNEKLQSVFNEMDSDEDVSDLLG